MIWLQIAATAVLSSALTLGVAWWVFERHLKPRLEADLAARLAAAGDELGRVIEERVRRGVVTAIEDLPKSEILKDTTRAAARTGVEIFGESLSRLLGGGDRR